MLLEDLYEAAHVRAFEVMRQADRQAHRAYRVLLRRLTVENCDWAADIPDADVIKRQPTRVRAILYIDQRLIDACGVRCGHRIPRSL
jgi:hypothetical protein